MTEEARSSYSAFAQLAIARYQPNSVEGRHISPIIKTDMIQLFPTRLLTIVRSGRDLKVKVQGAFLKQPAEMSAPIRSRVDAILELDEERAESVAGDVISLDRADETLGTWRRVTYESSEFNYDGTTQEMILSVPDDRPHRVRIREVEVFHANGATPHVSTPSELNERVVYSAIVHEHEI